MIEPPEKIVIINGKKFIDVTNETCAGQTYSYNEAYELSKGNKVASSN